MSLKLDHLVILVRDLQQAQTDYRQLGFTVTPGGTHADGLTHNALVVFADGTYLELIAFRDPHDPRDNTWGWRQFVVRGEGLIDYCMASDDLARDVAAFNAHGLTITGPVDGGRRRPDGVELRWRSARFRQAGRALPFLIEDLTPREWRVPGGAATEHTNRVRGIRELAIAVTDLPRLADQFAKLLDVTQPPKRHTPQGDTLRASFTVGAQTITLATAARRESPIRRRIESIGPGPCIVRLSTTRGASAASFDRALTHSVALEI